MNLFITGDSFKHLVLYFTALKKKVHFLSEGYIFSFCDLRKSLCAPFSSTDSVTQEQNTLTLFNLLSYCFSNQYLMRKGITPHKEPKYAF